MKIITLLTCLLTPLSMFSQSMSYDTLFIPKRTAFLLQADTLLANYLILADSSAIILGGQITVIKTHHLAVGIDCRIIGDGMDASATLSPQNSDPILKAADGENGKSLVLVSSSFNSKSNLSIFLNGGNGSDGSITLLPGGGGNGGNLLIFCSDSEKSKVNQQIIIENNGGLTGRSSLSFGLGTDTRKSLTSKKGEFKIAVY